MSKNESEENEKSKHPFHEPPSPSSLDEPLSGVKPDEVPCPICGKAFKSKSQMERHKQTTHEELEGHSY